MARWPDSKTGYIEVPGGPSCGGCKYIRQDHYCSLPVVAKEVDPKDGCCGFWDDGSKQPGIWPPPGEGLMSRLRRRR